MKEGGADLAIQIDAGSIQTAAWTVYRCQFGCDIDVFATVRNNGLEIHTLREKGEVQNHFGLLLVE